MLSHDLYERVSTCPHCFAVNTLVSNSVSPQTTLKCSSCSQVIGTVADMHAAFIEHIPEYRIAGREADHQH